jgi:hypothetical protein
MATNDRTSLQLRAQEIIIANPDGMTVREALKRAILERYPNDPERIAEAFAAVAQSAMSGLRKKTYELPDDRDLTLFEVPEVIGVRTEDGDLLVTRQAASLGQVKSWQKDGHQYHSTQTLRFKRAGQRLDSLKDEDDELPWINARHMLTAAEEDSSDGNDEE